MRLSILLVRCAETGSRSLLLLLCDRRQYPIDLGHTSSYIESRIEPEVERLACRLLERVRITGLVELEFKRDQRDGTIKLLDINPRVWGWHTFGARAGVDFSFLTWRMFTAQNIEKRRGCANVRWIRGITDLMAAAQAIPSKRFSLLSHLHSIRPPIACAIWAYDDPMPAVYEIPTIIRAQRRLARGMTHPLKKRPWTSLPHQWSSPQRPMSHLS